MELFHENTTPHSARITKDEIIEFALSAIINLTYSLPLIFPIFCIPYFSWICNGIKRTYTLLLLRMKMIKKRELFMTQTKNLRWPLLVRRLNQYRVLTLFLLLPILRTCNRYFFWGGLIFIVFTIIHCLPRRRRHRDQRLQK